MHNDETDRVDVTDLLNELTADIAAFEELGELFGAVDEAMRDQLSTIDRIEALVLAGTEESDEEARLLIEHLIGEE